MPDQIENALTPTGVFRAHFGSPPESTDAKTQCKNWEKLCGELLDEREKLRAELARVQTDCQLYRKSLLHKYCKDYQPDFDEAIGFAHLDDKPTLRELIAELENTPGN